MMNSPLKILAERNSLDGKIVQVSLIGKNPESDLDVTLEDFPSKMMYTFPHILDRKHGINFIVRIHVRYTHPTNEHRNREPPMFPSGKRIISRTLVLMYMGLGERCDGKTPGGWQGSMGMIHTLSPVPMYAFW